MREEREEEAKKTSSFYSGLNSAFRCENLRSTNKLRVDLSLIYELIIIFSGNKYEDKKREVDGRIFGEEKRIKVVMMRRENEWQGRAKVMRLYALVCSTPLDGNTWRLCH